MRFVVVVVVVQNESISDCETDCTDDETRVQKCIQYRQIHTQHVVIGLLETMPAAKLGYLLFFFLSANLNSS